MCVWMGYGSYYYVTIPIAVTKHTYIHVSRIIFVKISQAKYVPLAAKYNRHGVVNSST